MNTIMNTITLKLQSTKKLLLMLGVLTLVPVFEAQAGLLDAVATTVDVATDPYDYGYSGRWDRDRGYWGRGRGDWDGYSRRGYRDDWDRGYGRRGGGWFW